MVDLRLNTSLSIGRRWGSTSTSLQILLSRDVVLDAIMSLCNKTRLLTRQGVADRESISTLAMDRQVGQLQIVMQAQRVPKLLPIQCQVLLFKGYGVEPRACTIVSGLHCSFQQVQLLHAVLLLALRSGIPRPPCAGGRANSFRNSSGRGSVWRKRTGRKTSFPDH